MLKSELTSSDFGGIGITDVWYSDLLTIILLKSMTAIIAGLEKFVFQSSIQQSFKKVIINKTCLLSIFKIAVRTGFCFYGCKKRMLWLLCHSKLKPPKINWRKKHCQDVMQWYSFFKHCQPIGMGFTYICIVSQIMRRHYNKLIKLLTILMFWWSYSI